MQIVVFTSWSATQWTSLHYAQWRNSMPIASPLDKRSQALLSFCHHPVFFLQPKGISWNQPTSLQVTQTPSGEIMQLQSTSHACVYAFVLHMPVTVTLMSSSTNVWAHKKNCVAFSFDPPRWDWIWRFPWFLTDSCFSLKIWSEKALRLEQGLSDDVSLSTLFSIFACLRFW